MYDEMKEKYVESGTGDFGVITGHASKGLEFEECVELGSDFRPAFDPDGKVIDLRQDAADTVTKGNLFHHKQEMNIIYIAITRCMNKLLLPHNILAFFD